MTIEQILELIAIVLGSNWLGAFLLELYKNKKKKKSPLERMILSLGRDRLLFNAKVYIKMGGIPEDEYESFSQMFQDYAALHGNSTVAKLCKEALGLPIIHSN